MAFCEWCGKKTTVGKYGYCADCDSELRGAIEHYRNLLAGLGRQANCELNSSEKARILELTDDYCAALQTYKDRGVSFFTSDISEWKRTVAANLSLPPRFEPITLTGMMKKSVVVDQATVRIIRAASLLASTREKSIPIRNISGIEIKKPGPVINGFIQFQTAGQAVFSSSFKCTGGTYDAVADENAVVFSGLDNYDIALQIKAYVERCAEPNPAPAVMQQQAAPASVADELLKLKKLLDAGVLTQEEFNAQKSKLLG